MADADTNLDPFERELLYANLKEYLMIKENLIESDLLKCRKLSHYDGLLRSSIELRSNGLSIRCLKD